MIGLTGILDLVATFNIQDSKRRAAKMSTSTFKRPNRLCRRFLLFVPMLGTPKTVAAMQHFALFQSSRTRKQKMSRNHFFWVVCGECHADEICNFVPTCILLYAISNNTAFDDITTGCCCRDSTLL